MFLTWGGRGAHPAQSAIHTITACLISTLEIVEKKREDWLSETVYEKRLQ